MALSGLGPDPGALCAPETYMGLPLQCRAVQDLLAQVPPAVRTLCDRLADQGCELVVVSSDKDLMQLVTNGVKLLDSAKDRWIGKDEVKEKFGVAPEQVIEVMGLMGDAVDNIPGVKGIGAKSAVALLEKFSGLAAIYQRLEAVAKMPLRGAASIRAKLEAGREMAALSQKLATLACEAPIKITTREVQYRGAHRGEISTLFERLGFGKIRDRIPLWQK